jgi:hypothetical protein
MSVPTPFPLGNALSVSEKTEALADNLENQFQPLTDPSLPVDFETVNVGLRPYFMSPAIEPKLTITEEVRKPSVLLKLARLRAQTVFRTGL